MIIFSQHHTKLMLYELIRQLLAAVLYPSIDAEVVKQVGQHLHGLATANEHLIVTCRLETFPEKQTTAIWLELSQTNPVVDSGKRVMQ